MKLLYNVDIDKTAELVNNKVILITGGTGTLGKNVPRLLYRNVKRENGLSSVGMN